MRSVVLNCSGALELSLNHFIPISVAMIQCHHDTHFVHSIDNTSEFRYSNGRPRTSHDAGGMRLLVETGDSLSPSFLSTASISLAMLFLLLVYFLGGDASPIPLLEQRADVSCDDLNQCRTIWNIVWSCLSTIFLCTWVSLHPNIAIAPDTRGMSWFAKLWHPLRAFLKNKLLLFLCALIAPEYILAWAARQYLRAREIQRECNTGQRNADGNPVPFREWTQAHGFFLIMGGFHLYSLPDDATSVAYQPELSISSKFVLPLPGHSREGARAEHPLDFKDLSPNELAYFAPNEEEINDKGKADRLAKYFVILQTAWFIAQCIARGVEHLPLTELEVVTLAYAAMNLVIYVMWWDKPQDVECPVRVYTASSAVGVESGETKEWRGGVKGVSQRIATYVIGRQDAFCQLHEERQVPMFWSGNSGDLSEASSMGALSNYGVIFGSIHFIAWNADFPSHVELLLWRISCIAMTAIPFSIMFISLTMGMDHVFSDMFRNMFRIISRIISRIPSLTFRPNLPLVVTSLRLPPIVQRITKISLLSTLPVTTFLYVLARIATLVMAFTTLRALPSDAFKTVDWTTFIPHL